MGLLDGVSFVQLQTRQVAGAGVNSPKDFKQNQTGIGIGSRNNFEEKQLKLDQMSLDGKDNTPEYTKLRTDIEINEKQKESVKETLDKAEKRFNYQG